MGINIGLDIGAVSLKLAALGEAGDRETLESLAKRNSNFRFYPAAPWPLAISSYRRIGGSPIQSAYALLNEFYEDVGEDRIEGLRVTGSGSRAISKILGIYFENEFKAIARMMASFHPNVRTIFEIGGESSRFILLEGNATHPGCGILDYDHSGECAAGTGSFLDQQALRMGYSVEEIGDLVPTAHRSASIAGRCSVFAKSDMIHAQQKGYTPAEILRGLCEAVPRNFKSSVVKGRAVTAPVAFLGAVSQCSGVTDALRKVFALEDGELVVPELYAWCGAIGAAILESEDPKKRTFADIHRLGQHEGEAKPFDNRPLSMENVSLLRERVAPYFPPPGDGPISAFVGIDVGSVSTNVVVLDANGRLIHEIYLRTAGRPIEAVQQGLAEVERLWGNRLVVQRCRHHRIGPRTDR